jgi:hypothetical protein
MKLMTVCVAAALVLTSTSVTHAQSNQASINATATVLDPISIAGDNDLDFGTVFPGINKTVPYTDLVNGGHWSISGATGREVDLTFTLPGTLASGGDNLTIVFAAASAARNTADVVGGATTFDPNGVETTLLSGGTPGELFIWIGGEVQPTIGQPGGNYSGTITLTVDYTGN